MLRRVLFKLLRLDLFPLNLVRRPLHRWGIFSFLAMLSTLTFHEPHAEHPLLAALSTELSAALRRHSRNARDTPGDMRWIDGVVRQGDGGLLQMDGGLRHGDGGLRQGDGETNVGDTSRVRGGCVMVALPVWPPRPQFGGVEGNCEQEMEDWVYVYEGRIRLHRKMFRHFTRGWDCLAQVYGMLLPGTK